MPSSSTDRGVLYVLATPIGNLEDLSRRAERVLAEADLICAEDTRRTGKLLAHLGVRTPMTALHDHNEGARAAGLIERVVAGESLVLVSDAGTPGVADPGYRLLRAAHDAGARVVPIPGPSALTALVSVSGLPSDRVLHMGFLPPKWGAAERAVNEVKDLKTSLVFFVSPYKLHKTMELLVRLLGEREACLGRELTKLHEELIRGTLPEVAAAVAERKPRGEYVLMVGPAPKSR